MFNNENLITNDDFLGTNADIPTFDYNSFYRGIVMSVEDPEHLGRIRVKIPSLHSNVSQNYQYPYAYPACFVGLGNQVGQFILPPVGSIVFVAFEYSSEHRPIYFGGVPTTYADGKAQSYGVKINNGEEKEVTTDDIPTEYTGSQAIIYKSPSGAILYFDDNTYKKQLVFKDSVGQLFRMQTYTTSTGTLVKESRLQIDKDNYISFKPDTITICISGEIFTFTKENISGGGSSGGSDCELVIWD